jgi:hypothetical protein
MTSLISQSRKIKTTMLFGPRLALMTACPAQAAAPSSLREVSNVNRERLFQLAPG